MQLLVVRHAAAVEAAESASSHGDDAKRPLTDDGRKKMVRGATGLRRAASPLVRARQTADIPAEEFEG